MGVAKLGILGHLYREGSMTPGALAAAEGVQPQSLTRVLADLEESAYVLRQQDELDRRQFRLELTPQGRDAIERDAGRRAAWLSAAMISCLSPTEQQILRLAGELMDKLAEFSGEPRPEHQGEDQKEEPRDVY